MNKKIAKALISVYHKNNLDELIHTLAKQGVELYSTGGTQTFIESLGYRVNTVESLTGFPAILGGRVKTLDPHIFGGILARRNEKSDMETLAKYQIPTFDLVIVDLYPFEETVKSGAKHEDIIEKIDIGGISLIRAAAKNYEDVVIISSQNQYSSLCDILKESGETTLAQRKSFAAQAFAHSSDYDTRIFQYFNQEEQLPYLKESFLSGKTLRYGENPHQKGVFYGDLSSCFDQLHGKEISYNNLVDVEAAIQLSDDLGKDLASFVIIKHTNACGVACAETLDVAYSHALACDPTSAFGGVLVANQTIDEKTAILLDKLFFEILIAPDFSQAALEILDKKKNRILLKRKPFSFPKKNFKTLLNGVLAQDADMYVEQDSDLKTVTKKAPTQAEIKALLFASKICKHTKSNTIVLAKENILIASGVGQTSRVDALQQAIEKAHNFGFSLEGAAMASDAFFPFPDCVEIAFKAGIKTVIQPGGSIKDQASIDFCDANGISMVLTGIRHFKH